MINSYSGAKVNSTILNPRQARAANRARELLTTCDQE